ncbi:hypothetical protein [uncultured Jannaschia sp.]|uniref:hypothetical protein n=1 Tax=uncultured Jannaschia sp. TaxID=293347 RepID=UPI002614A8DD|nr:hypothetical protein [uncultured Jannaschia sp.]
MLTCTVIAGILFLSGDGEGKSHNFHHVANFSLSDTTTYLNTQIEGKRVRFEIPEELRADTAIGIVRNCARQGQADANSAALSGQN